MSRFLVSLLCVFMFSCVGPTPTAPPPKEPEPHGFVVKRCIGDDCLKQWLKKLSENVSCSVLGMSTTYECNLRCIGGYYVHTVIAECPEPTGDVDVRDMRTSGE